MTKYVKMPTITILNTVSKILSFKSAIRECYCQTISTNKSKTKINCYWILDETVA